MSSRKQVKDRLLMEYGKYCWYCGKKFKREGLTIHHIHQFCETHTTTYEDSMILCYQCHFEYINNIPYGSKEYWNEMYEILHRMGREEFFKE